MLLQRQPLHVAGVDRDRLVDHERRVVDERVFPPRRHGQTLAQLDYEPVEYRVRRAASAHFDFRRGEGRIGGFPLDGADFLRFRQAHVRDRVEVHVLLLGRLQKVKKRFSSFAKPEAAGVTMAPTWKYRRLRTLKCQTNKNLINSVTAKAALLLKNNFSS